MITIGIDASTRATGYGVFDGVKLIDYGLIKPKGSDWREKIKKEWEPLCNLIDKYKPDKLYIEDVPKKPGSATLIKLGAVQGTMLALSACKNIPIDFLLPTDWRRSLGLYDGTREGLKSETLKKKAIDMANEKFNLDLLWVAPKSTRNDDDIAEAILIAYSQIKPRFIGETHTK